MLVRQFFTVVCLLCVALPSRAAAQDKTPNALKAGAWSLQFEIDEDFDVNSFEGSTLSIKKQTSETSAWRVGLSVAVNARLTDGVSKQEDSIRSSSDNHNQSQSIGVTLHRMWYPNPDNPVKMFVGLGPTGGFSHGSSGRSRTSSSGAFVEDDIDAWSWSAGLSGVLGVEWFAARNISLIAEYGSTLEYYRSKNERTERRHLLDEVVESTVENNLEQLSFDAQSVKFGLSVYF